MASDPRPRAFDLPWVVLDASRARDVWEWTPQTLPEAILDEIAAHAEANPDWLHLSWPHLIIPLKPDTHAAAN